jgi:hypothetical protein
MPIAWAHQASSRRRGSGRESHPAGVIWTGVPRPGASRAGAPWMATGPADLQRGTCGAAAIEGPGLCGDLDRATADFVIRRRHGSVHADGRLTGERH